MSEGLKSPCRGCDHEFDNKRDEPCASCPLPGQYDDALKKTFFPSQKHLRHSTPNNWGGKPIKISNMINRDPKPKTKRIRNVSIPEKNESVDVTEKKNKPEILRLLEQYCAQEGVSVKQITGKSRSPVIAASRQRIAIALFEQEGIDQQTIAAVMKKCQSSVWSWFNSGIDSNSDRLVDKILNEMPETLTKLMDIAKQELRSPIDQIRFIVREYCNK